MLDASINEENILTFDEEAHVYKLNGKSVPSVTQIIKTAGFYKNSEFFTEEAANRGTYVHKACDMYDNDILDMNSSELDFKGYIDAWIAFREQSKAEIIETEKRVYSEVWMFAGTLDRVVKMNNKMFILDIKTGSPQPAADPLQTAAYQMAYGELKGTKIEGRGCVYLSENGKFTIKYHEQDREDWADFLAALRVWYRKKNFRLIY